MNRVLPGLAGPWLGALSTPSAGRAEPAHAAPAIAEAARQLGGMIDVTPDGISVISAVDALPGFFIATWFTGHGFGIAPGAVG